MSETGDTSYLDLCVHHALRPHVLSADSAVLFSADLKRILWCNAYGAKAFGGTGVADLLAAKLSDEQSFVHQLRSVLGRLERSSIVTARFRLQDGQQKRLIPFDVSKISLKDEIGYLVVGRPDGKTPGKQKIAKTTVESLNGFADHAAVLNRSGETLKASPEFGEHAPDKAELKTTLAELADEEDRLVKRLVENSRGEAAALGIALVSDKPWRALAVLAKADIDEEATLAETEGKETTEDNHGANSNPSERNLEPALDESQEVELPGETEGELHPYAITEPADAVKQDENFTEISSEETVPSQNTAVSNEERDHDETLRFTWAMDAENRFEEVSGELALAVGHNAADIVGRRWQDVANAFAMDEDHEIERRLDAKDTWSGRTVLWPVEGAEERVPIQLAALPRYDLKREFHGFRGFGEVQLNDRVPDPQKIGLALVSSVTKRAVDEEAWSKLGEEEDEPVAQEGHGENSDDGEPEILLHSTIEPENEAGAGLQSNVVPLNPNDEKNSRLTSSEANAFQKIADTLREDEKSNVLPLASIAHTRTETLDQQRRQETSSHNRETTSTAPDNVESDADQDHEVQVPSSENTGLLERLPVSVLIYDDEQLLFANRNFLHVTGYGSLEALEITGGIDTVLEKRDEETSLSVKTHSGASLPVDAKLHTVPWHGKKAMMLSFAERQTTSLDSIDTEPSLAGLAGSRTLLSLLNITRDGIALTDSQGAIVSLNASAEETFGLSSREITGEPLSTLFSADSEPTISGLLADAIGPGVSSVRLEARQLSGRKADGEPVDVDISVTRMNESGEALIVMRPSDTKDPEQYSRDSDEQEEETETRVLAQVSHEIRTPLNAIIGFSDMMIEEQYGSIDNDRYRQYLKDIKRSGKHVLELVNDLLDLSKMESGQMELNFEAIDLNPLIAETVALLQPQANAARIVIRTSLSNAVPKVVADTRSIRQIILNLVSNAINYSEPNGQVIVSSVYEDSGEVALRIKDKGPGMTQEELEEALRPFRQIKPKSSNAPSGTGLGLPLTKALVEANRAYFDLESEPGKGTVAHVQFPSQRILAD